MALIRGFVRRVCDDRILALRSLALHHRTPVGLGWKSAVAAVVPANLLVCGLVMHNFLPAGDHETAALFLLGETAVLLGFFVLVIGPSLGPILDRARLAGVDMTHQRRFVLLEFVAHPVTVAVWLSLAVAFVVTLISNPLSAVLALPLALSWLGASAAAALSFISVGREFNVTPGAIAVGFLVVVMLLVLGPLAVTGEPILSYLPICGWTTNGVVALQRGDLLTAGLWATLQFLAAAAVIVGLSERGDPHAGRA